MPYGSKRECKIQIVKHTNSQKTTKATSHYLLYLQVISFGKNTIMHR